MANISANKNSAGDVISYRFRACVGRDDLYRQVWRTTTVKRPEGLTPARERKEVARLADAWEVEQKELYERNRSKPDAVKKKQNVTLASYIEKKWLPNHVRNGEHTPATIAFFEYMSADIITYFGTHVRLGEIDGEKLETYQIYLRTEAKTKTGKPYSETTIKRHMETLRNILRHALAHEYIKDDPFSHVYAKAKAKDEAHDVDFLRPDEAAAFLKALESEPLYWRCFMRILLSCGLRRGEAVGLQWQDWDAVNMRLYVRRNVTVSSGGWHIGQTKNKRQRIVPITPKINQLLAEHQADQTRRYGEELPKDGFVFCAAASPAAPIYPTTATRWLTRFEKRHGLRGVSPHDLRHSAVSLAKLAGADLKDIQTLLGHSDLKTTVKFYLGVTEESTRSVVLAAENLIGEHEEWGCLIRGSSKKRKNNGSRL